MRLIDLLVKELPKIGGWPEKVTHIGQDFDRELMLYGRGNVRTGIILDELAIDHRKRCEAGITITHAQYESALAANEGWIEWGGGECPVERGTIVDVKHRDGEISLNAESLSGKAETWSHEETEHPGDIIAYRLHRDINPRANDDRLAQDLNECIGQDADMPEWNGEGLPPVGCECEVKSGDTFADYDWVKIKVAYSHMGELIGIVDMPGESIHNDMEKLSYWYCGAIFRPLRTESEKEREKLAASLHIAAGASPIELNGIGPLCFKLADAIISGSVFGTTFKAGK